MRKRIRRLRVAKRKVSLLYAVKNDLSYNQAVRQGIKIRKKDYFLLKKLYKTKDITYFFMLTTKRSKEAAKKLINLKQVSKIPNRLLISEIFYTKYEPIANTNKIGQIILKARSMILNGYDNITIFRKIKNEVLKFKDLFKNYRLFELEFTIYNNFNIYFTLFRTRKYLNYDSEFINTIIWAANKLIEIESYNSINIKDVKVWLIR